MLAWMDVGDNGRCWPGGRLEVLLTVLEDNVGPDQSLAGE